MKLEISDRFSKYTQISNFMKIRQVGGGPSCSTRTDGHADMMKLIVAFRNFCESACKRTDVPKLGMIQEDCLLILHESSSQTGQQIIQIQAACFRQR